MRPAAWQSMAGCPVGRCNALTSESAHTAALAAVVISWPEACIMCDMTRTTRSELTGRREMALAHGRSKADGEEEEYGDCRARRACPVTDAHLQVIIHLLKC
jgi:hypothetical protein